MGQRVSLKNSKRGHINFRGVRRELIIPSDEDLVIKPTLPGDVLEIILPLLGPLPEVIVHIIAEYASSPYEWSGTPKILILGGRYVGKTTLYKQMVQHCGGGFTEKGRSGYRFVVCKNIQESFAALTRNMEGKHFSANNRDWKDDRGLITEENRKILTDLWSDREIRNRFDKRAGLHLHFVREHLPYYMEQINRITNDKYVPTMDDIYRTYQRTSGICEVNGTFPGGGKFRAFDVGGCRPERKKWIHCFENVEIVIFVSDISAFDEVLFEDENVPRVQEDLRLFDEICNSEWFSEYPSEVIVCLNKVDIFAEKLKTVAFDEYFPDYTGDIYNVEECKEYLKEQFDDLVSRELVTLDENELRIPKTPTWRGRDTGVRLKFTNFLEEGCCLELLEELQINMFRRLAVQNRRRSVKGLSDSDIRSKYKKFWDTDEE